MVVSRSPRGEMLSSMIFALGSTNPLSFGMQVGSTQGPTLLSRPAALLASVGDGGAAFLLRLPLLWGGTANLLSSVRLLPVHLRHAPPLGFEPRPFDLGGRCCSSSAWRARPATVHRMGFAEQAPTWANGPSDDEMMRTLRRVSQRPCETRLSGRCPRDNTCAPCQAFWLLLHDRTPVTWAIVSVYWIAKISS